MPRSHNSSELPPVRDALAAAPILHACSAAVLDLLAREATFARLHSSASIFERGSQPTGLFLVHHGAVRLMALGPDGKAKVVEIFEQGGMFGEIGVFTGERFRTWTKAIGQTVLIHVPRACVLEAVHIDNALANRMLTAVCKRTQGLVDAISSASSGAAHVRVAAYLLDMHDSRGTADSALTLPAPKNAIASLLNLTPETFSRVLRNMLEDKLLMVGGRRIRLLDPTGLRRLVAEGAKRPYPDQPSSGRSLT